jgi:hypothetical protein
MRDVPVEAADVVSRGVVAVIGELKARADLAGATLGSLAAAEEAAGDDL